LSGRQNVLVEQMSDSLSNVDTAGRIGEAEIATPEVVAIVEF